MKKEIEYEVKDESEIRKLESSYFVKKPKRPAIAEIVPAVFMITLALIALLKNMAESLYICMVLFALALQIISRYYSRKKYYDFYMAANEIINFHKNK